MIFCLVLGDNFFGENPIKNIDFADLKKMKGSIIFTKEVEILVNLELQK